MRGIHRSPVNSPHKGQWRGALVFTLICARINGWINNVRLVIWDAIVVIMTSLYWGLPSWSVTLKMRVLEIQARNRNKQMHSHSFLWHRIKCTFWDILHHMIWAKTFRNIFILAHLYKFLPRHVNHGRLLIALKCAGTSWGPFSPFKQLV